MATRGRSTEGRAATARAVTLRLAGLGFVLGAAWGATARLFMRFLATEPTFSWVGTLGIIGLSAWLGAVLGVVRAARLRGASRWWRLTALLGVLLFAGPGLVLLPTVAAVMVAVRLRRRPVRVVLVALGLAGTLAPLLGSPDEPVAPDQLVVVTHLVAPVPGVVLLVTCAVLLGLGCSEASRRWEVPAETTGAARPGVGAAVV